MMTCLKWLSCVLYIDHVELFLKVCDLLRLYEDVGGLATGAAAGLVHHNSGVGETVAHALGPGGQQQRAHATGLHMHHSHH